MAAKTKPDELYLIDGNSLAYRAFFALPESIATSTGFPTNAIFGFASMLVKLMTEHGSQPTICVWDKGHSGRKEVYTEYKAQRTSRPDLLKQQWPHIVELCEAFGYPNVSVEGYEADDVIASIAERAREKGVPSVIVTGDRDAFQLIGDDGLVKVMATARGITDTKLYDRQAVIDRYGIAPELIPDFYGLKGDTSDNIPGVPGIGDKTAADLLQRFGDLETILASVEEISGAKRKENLTNHADNARISRELATIQRDVPVDIDPTAELTRAPDRSKLRETFRHFELRDPLRRLEEALGDPEEAAPAPVAETTLAAEVREAPLASLAKALPAGAEVAVAVTEPEIAEGELFAAEPVWRWAVSAGELLLAGDCARPEDLVAALGDRPVVVHDAKRLGVVPERLVHDTLLGAFLLEPARRSYPFADLAEERGFATTVEDPTAAAALLTAALAGWQREQLEERGLQPLMDDVELPLVAVLRGDGAGGRPAQPRDLRDDQGEGRHRDRLAGARGVGARGGGVRARLPAAARAGPLREARPLPQAPRQDGLLHRRAGAPGDPRRAPGRAEDRALARAQPALEDLPGRAAAPRRRRGADPHDVPAGQRADRPAGSTDPNMQNVPVRTELGREIRRCFEAAPGHVLLSADYSQVELRVLAHVADEPVLKQIFLDGLDVHTATASQVFGRCARGAHADGPVQGEDDQLRHRLRPLGLRPRRPAEHRPRGGQGVHRRLPRALRPGARVHDRDDRARHRGGPRHDALRAPSPDPGAEGAQLPGAHPGRAPGGQHDHPGHRGRRHEARDDRRPPGARGRGALHAVDPDDPRRAALRGARGGDGRRSAPWPSGR